eukprot:CAMPEP_0167777950 /NCGR_PEP_ID=MMETSP0111_2-20121227/3986_1 /TAXON_ID=91324 /ORGANISM="Lotharella globosa, Strain CCCM811" /LENGTH=272 /DNA_ID=CAMNT_0007668207 /DNA_START=1 /DNA_END=822 /DNA_ORIENTATION=-
MSMLEDILAELQNLIKACCTPTGRSIIGAGLIAIALYAAYCKIQLAKERQQLNRRREGRNRERKTAESVRRCLTPHQRYLEGQASSRPKVLLASEVIFEHGEDKKEFTVRSDATATLVKMCKNSDVHVIFRQVEDDPSDEKIKERAISSLSEAGVIDAGFQQHRIVVCSTTQGKAHVARHLMPSLYMDVDVLPLKMVSQYIEDTVLVHSSSSTDIPEKVKASPMFSTFFSAIKKRVEMKNTVEKPKVTNLQAKNTQAAILRRRTAGSAQAKK